MLEIGFQDFLDIRLIFYDQNFLQINHLLASVSQDCGFIMKTGHFSPKAHIFVSASQKNPTHARGILTLIILHDLDDLADAAELGGEFFDDDVAQVEVDGHVVFHGDVGGHALEEDDAVAFHDLL